MTQFNSIADVIRRHATITPDRVALLTDNIGVSYLDLQAHSSRVAAALMKSGVSRGDRVSYLGKNSSEFFYLLIGAAQIGAIVVPLNWRLAVPELLEILADASPKVLVVGADHTRIGTEIALVNTEVEVVAINSEDAPVPGPVIEYERWSDAEVFDLLPTAFSEDTAMLVYTSGTTGRPKGAMISHRSLLLHLQALSSVAGISDSSVSISTLPVFHIGGSSWTLAGLWAGCTTVQFRDVVPVQVLESIAQHKGTNLIAVPSVIQALVDALPSVEQDFKSLQRLYYGGGPVSTSVLGKALEAFDCDFVQGFGMTECALVAALEPKFHHRPELLRSCGRPIADTEVRLVDSESLADVPVGDVGELWVRSPRVMSGYWNKPEITAETITSDGWLRTGDAASMDAEGFLYIRDRLKDMIITGGENVYCAEVENVLMEHPDILECAVIGVPSEKWTETVKAVVVLAPESDADQKQIVQFCRQRLAGYKCPTSVEFLPVLPRTPSGKLQKFLLREQYWS
ncbi:long-chain-fatty-acid--CoA ligase (plasmid) [Rhodococcus qingshengii]|uniref:long-chain-fatty-acid--CoA ligase n=1 Tax=Rhodococcus qingshengii TaxID=334542 RepID=UPI001E3974C5|nr:long-chain-fatty-acid--CoA ligase [Rhodococcus qingshengii]UGQ55416.1 long-chain-fatty-acid--CoA ligase [Rhodococcus qingshengii]